MSDGRIGNSNQYLQISGVVSAPAYSFASDNDTGIYRIGANNIGIAANGSKVLDISNTAVTITPATTLSAALTYGGVTLNNAVTGTGNMVLSASPTLSGTITLPSSTVIASSGRIGVLGAVNTGAAVTTVGSGIFANAGESNTAFAGNPTDNIAITGPGGYWAIRSDTSHNFILGMYNSGTEAKALQVAQAGGVTLGAALTYGGVTLSNSVTGTGSMVLSTSPSMIEPTATGNNSNNSLRLARNTTFVGGAYIYANSSDMFGVNDGTNYPFRVVQGASNDTLVAGTSTVTVGKALVYGGVTLSNSVTGTGSMVLSAGPTITGALTVDSFSAPTTNQIRLRAGTAVASTGGIGFAACDPTSAGFNDSLGLYAYRGIAFHTNTPAIRMLIDVNGNVGINKTPAYTLDVSGRGGFDATLYLAPTNNTYPDALNIARKAGANSITFSNTFTVYGSDSSAIQMQSGGSGGVTLTSGATAWAAISDETTKTDLVPILSGAEKVASLRAVTGRYKTDAENVSRSFLIAQDVQAVLPEAVSVDDDGILSLRYSEVIPLLVAAIKELNGRLAALEA